jgi:hypothetical protein
LTVSGLDFLFGITLELTRKMANIKKKKGVIGILTGGGDVPGLNPAIRGVTFRALREGYDVIGLRRGWGGLVDIVREKDYDNSENFVNLSESVVNRAARTGGTFLHTSRTNPSRVAKDKVPAHLQSQFNAEKNDLTPEVMKNLEWLGIDYLIPIGGDDTLSYGVRLYQEGVKVVAIIEGDIHPFLSSGEEQPLPFEVFADGVDCLSVGNAFTNIRPSLSAIARTQDFWLQHVEANRVDRGVRGLRIEVAGFQY